MLKANDCVMCFHALYDLLYGHFSSYLRVNFRVLIFRCIVRHFVDILRKFSDFPLERGVV